MTHVQHPPLECAHVGITEAPTVPSAVDAFAWCQTCHDFERIVRGGEDQCEKLSN